ncbi:hypothetical protein BST86_06305 [Nonlabens agnitus]|uniref:Uncharacterized protein n=1 Tax=Nonlabens agnitus TaxID=870484 RepID=A0A2S9WTD5_9FLAO|nr:hypothetical protein BST86_06305 [Nonlabens agnitus]
MFNMGILATNENRATLKVRIIFSVVCSLITTALLVGANYWVDMIDFEPTNAFIFLLGYSIILFLTSYFFLKTNKEKGR